MLAALRKQIADVVAPRDAVEDTLATGVAALDGAFPGGGIPCRRLTEIAGTAGHGATTIVRSLVAQTLRAKHWVAYIDASRTLAPADWAPLARSGRLWIVRPPTDDRGAWCADVLLRSGAFGLVVLDGASPVSRATAVRLTRLARESNAAFVVLRDTSTPSSFVGSALRIHVERRLPSTRTLGTRTAAERWHVIGTRLAAAGGRPNSATPSRLSPASTRGTVPATIVCTITKGGRGGQHHHVEVPCVVVLARRVHTDSEVPDRRGVAPRNRRGERATPDAPGARRSATPAGAAATADDPRASVIPAHATLQHKRRCAEPAIRHDEFLLQRPPASAARPRSTRRSRATGVG